MIDLPALTAALRNGTDLDESRSQRLLDALRDEQASSRDIAPLLRQVLVGAQSSYDTPSLIVPEREGLASACLAVGVAPEPYGRDELRVSGAEPLEFADVEGRSCWIDLATAAPGDLHHSGSRVDTQSRQKREVAADPMFARLTCRATHPVPEQREAVRQVALAPPGAVTHVVLPTGAGKTLVGLLPALADPGQQVIVVVPTVAIALDQERTIREGSDHGGLWEGTPPELAWHGELPKEQRATIRERLLAGTQRVLFTSPESMVTSLEPTLLAAANRGRIHTLVFDEAHLISSWGLDFRPEMQLVASVREQLIAATSRGGSETIRTVLLTATLDRSSLELNSALFGGGSARSVVGAPALRTEPRFLRVQVTDDAERAERLTQLMAVLPRPAIVYATKVATAEAAAANLREAGFRRLALFTGDTDGRSRGEILADWRGVEGASRVDVVVGTAAFGLGVDQSNVRSVVHIEAPASIGSFYQEVGRGGRDGHACVSVLVANERDLIGSAQVGDATIIGADKAWKRWKAMATTLSAGEPATVDVRVVPDYLPFANQRNELWNKNTLVLLERAGLLRLVPQPIPETGAEASVWEERRGRVGLEFLRDENLSYDLLEHSIRRLAAGLHTDRRGERGAVAELLSGQRCFGELFARAYSFTIDDDRGWVSSRPTPACSGCPGCRRSDLRAADVTTAAFHVVATDAAVPGLSQIIADARTLVVHESPEWLDRHGPELLTRLVNAGCRHLFVADIDRRLARALERLPYVAVDEQPQGFPPFVRPSILWRPAHVDSAWQTSPGPVRVIVTESGTPAPDRPDHDLAEWWAPARRGRRLLEQL